MKELTILWILCFSLFSCHFFNASKKVGENNEIIDDTKQKECKNINDYHKTINWLDIKSKQLPFAINAIDINEGNDRISWPFNLKEFYDHYNAKFGIYSEVNTLFSNNTEFDHKPWDIFEEPSIAGGYFFCRLPNINCHRAIIFASFDKRIGIDYSEKSVWLELQLFNDNNENTDKKIIYYSLMNECSIFRGFECDSNYNIQITDRIICRDTDENATLLSDETKSYKYEISNNGKFVKK